MISWADVLVLIPSVPLPLPPLNDLYSSVRSRRISKHCRLSTAVSRNSMDKLTSLGTN